MSNKSYPNWLKNCTHDPLWWIWIISLAIPVIIVILDLLKVINHNLMPYTIIFNVSLAVFGITLVLIAVRGKDIGENKPMTKGQRIFSAALGAFVAVVALALGIFLSL